MNCKEGKVKVSRTEVREEGGEARCWVDVRVSQRVQLRAGPGAHASTAEEESASLSGLLEGRRVGHQR